MAAANRLREAYQQGQKSLDVDCGGLTSLPDILPDTLISLKLTNGDGLTRLPESLPVHLRSLELAGCRSLQELPTNLPPSLRQLILLQCEHLSISADYGLPNNIDFNGPYFI